MIDQETVKQLEHAPLTDRIEAIEVLLQSLKNEIARQDACRTTRKPFAVREIDLGADIQFDREEIYKERGL